MNIRDLRILFYFLRGKRPWTLGYSEYKFLTIKTLCNPQINVNLFKCKKVTRFLDERVVEYPWVLSRIPKKPGTLLDAGSCLNYDFVINNKRLKNKKICVFNLTPDSRCFISSGISYFFGDLRNLPFKNSSFNYVTSISTLEHVGMNNCFLYTFFL